MKIILRFFAVLALVTIAGAAANAATVQDQINSAIASGNFDTVKSLVVANPNSGDNTVEALLKLVQDNLTTNPALAAKAMAAAEALVHYVGSDAASKIASAIDNIVKTIADKGLLICNPAGEDDKEHVATSKGNTDNEKLIAEILASAETMAQSPVIVAALPQLYAEIKAQNAQCEGNEEAQLAQLPIFKPLNNPPQRKPPETLRASQD